MTSLQVYGQEPTITTNSITDKIKTTSVQIKNTASEVVNNSTVKSTIQRQKIPSISLEKLLKKTALGGADVVSNFSGEIKEGLK